MTHFLRRFRTVAVSLVVALLFVGFWTWHLFPKRPSLEAITYRGGVTFSLHGPKAADERRNAEYVVAAFASDPQGLWVNLAPGEQARIIPSELAKTSLGKTLLESDLMLKKTVARLCAEAHLDLGAETSKVWIVPAFADVSVGGDTAVLEKATMKVVSRGGSGEKVIAAVGARLDEAINNGKEFSDLRDAYRAVIVARFLREHSAGKPLASYAGCGRLSGISKIGRGYVDTVYRSYTKAFDDPVRRFDPATSRVYVSGGFFAPMQGQDAGWYHETRSAGSSIVGKSAETAVTLNPTPASESIPEIAGDLAAQYLDSKFAVTKFVPDERLHYSSIPFALADAVFSHTFDSSAGVAVAVRLSNFFGEYPLHTEPGSRELTVNDCLKEITRFDRDQFLNDIVGHRVRIGGKKKSPFANDVYYAALMFFVQHGINTRHDLSHYISDPVFAAEFRELFQGYAGDTDEMLRLFVAPEQGMRFDDDIVMFADMTAGLDVTGSEGEFRNALIARVLRVNPDVPTKYIDFLVTCHDRITQAVFGTRKKAKVREHVSDLQLDEARIRRIVQEDNSIINDKDCMLMFSYVSQMRLSDFSYARFIAKTAALISSDDPVLRKAAMTQCASIVRMIRSQEKRDKRRWIIGNVGELSGLYEVGLKRGTRLRLLDPQAITAISAVFEEDIGEFFPLIKELDAVSDTSIFEFKFHARLINLYKQIVGVRADKYSHFMALCTPPLREIKNIVLYGENDGGNLIAALVDFVSRRGLYDSLELTKTGAVAVYFDLETLEDFMTDRVTLTALLGEEGGRNYDPTRIGGLAALHRRFDELRASRRQGARHFDVIISVSNPRAADLAAFVAAASRSTKTATKEIPDETVTHADAASSPVGGIDFGSAKTVVGSARRLIAGLSFILEKSK